MYEEIIYCADVIAHHTNGDFPWPFVIIERQGSSKGLALPGGKQEKRESLTETASRELYEETGLRRDNFGDFVAFKTFAKKGRDPRGAYVTTVFITHATGMPKDEKGKTRVLFLTKEEILERKNEFVFDHFSILEDYFTYQQRYEQ